MKMNKTKVDELVAKGNTAFAKGKTVAKAVLEEVKANFKADEGTAGFKKVQSRFCNLWKSGTVGKGAIVVGAVALLLLLNALGEGKEGKMIRIQEELREVSGEYCDLYDLLGKDKWDLTALMYCSPGRDLTEIDGNEDFEEFRKLSSKEKDAAITVTENLLADCRKELLEKRRECKEKGIKYDGDSPLRVTKEFISCLREKSGRGLKKLMHGDNKDKLVEVILKDLENADSGITEMAKLKRLGPTFFSPKRDEAAVALECPEMEETNDEQELYKRGRKFMSGSNDYEGCCLMFVKTEDGWRVDANMPFVSKN